MPTACVHAAPAFRPTSDRGCGATNGRPRPTPEDFLRGAPFCVGERLDVCQCMGLFEQNGLPCCLPCDTGSIDVQAGEADSKAQQDLRLSVAGSG